MRWTERNVDPSVITVFLSATLLQHVDSHQSCSHVKLQMDELMDGDFFVTSQ